MADPLLRLGYLNDYWDLFHPVMILHISPWVEKVNGAYSVFLHLLHHNMIIPYLIRSERPPQYQYYNSVRCEPALPTSLLFIGHLGVGHIIDVIVACLTLGQVT